MISEADLQEMRAADREIDRKTTERRIPTEERRKRRAETSRAWRARNPEKIASYAAKYREMNRENIKLAHRKRYRDASAAAVPNKEMAEWRQRLGIRQNTAAKLLGVSQSSYSTWENGIYPPPDWVMARIRGGREEVHHEADGTETL